MSARAWLAACLLALCSAGLGGWPARASTADHRYIRALAIRHETVTDYYLQQTGQQIRDNDHGRNIDGTKKN